MSAKRSFSSTFPATLSLGGMGSAGGSAKAAYRGRARPKYRKAAKVSKSVAQYVKKAISKTEEVKLAMGISCNQLVSYVTPFIGPISGPGNYTMLIPKIPTGVTNGERLGSEIRPKKLQVRGVVSLRGSVAQAWKVRVRMMVVQDLSLREGSSLSPLLAAAGNSLLMSDVGVGQTTGYTGGVQQHFLPINTDRYKVYKDFEFPLSLGSGTTSQQAPTLIAGTLVGDAWASEKAFDFTIPLPVLKFDDGIGSATNLPTNSSPMLYIGWCNVDDNTPSNGNGPVPVYTTFTTSLLYADA